MILKDNSSVPIFYDGEDRVVPVFPNSLAEAAEERMGPTTTGSDQENATQSWN